MLRYAEPYGAADNPLTQGSPTWADAASNTAQNVGDYIARQRAQSVAMGLLDPNTGLPTAAGVVNAGQQYGNALLMGTTAPGRLSGAMPSEAGFVYHATNAERLQDIAESGKLMTHKPGDFTDQDIWPDGSTEKRNYFTPTAENTWQFAPEEGQGALLRMRADAHPIKREGTGDLYSTKPVDAKHLEYLGADGGWHPVTALKGGQDQ